MSFASDLKRFQKKFDRATNEVISGVETALFSAVILDTPVDTGRLRANWQVSVNLPASAQTLSENDPTGQGVIAKTSGFVETLRGGRETFLTNNLAYAVPIEFGYSSQAPEGMVRKNVTRFQSLVNQEANKHKL